MANFLRKSDYMKNMRQNDTRVGPLKIVRLPSAEPPIRLSAQTPLTLAEMGFHKSNLGDSLTSLEKEILRDFEFQDVNENFEAIQLMNQANEMKVMASSKRYNKPVSEDGTITPDIMTTEEDKKNYERD